MLSFYRSVLYLMLSLMAIFQHLIVITSCIVVFFGRKTAHMTPSSTVAAVTLLAQVQSLYTAFPSKNTCNFTISCYTLGMRLGAFSLSEIKLPGSMFVDKLNEERRKASVSEFSSRFALPKANRWNQHFRLLVFFHLHIYS